jgi:hypothetical protein
MIDRKDQAKLWLLDYTGAKCSAYSGVCMSYPWIKENPVFHQHIQLRNLYRDLIETQESERIFGEMMHYLRTFQSSQNNLKDFKGFKAIIESR